MNNIQLWIDADSCPTLVRNHVIKTGKNKQFKILLVANKKIMCEEKPYTMIICSEEKDSADNYIYNHVQPFDLVITRDIVFASRLVEKNICCINDRGTCFTKENVKELLSERDFNLQLAECGVVKHFNEGYNNKKFSDFCACFDRELQKLIKSYSESGNAS